MAPQLSVHRLSAFVFKSFHEMKNKFKANYIFVKRLFTYIILEYILRDFERLCNVLWFLL